MEPIQHILNYLPDPVVDALEDHADTYGLTDAQVIGVIEGLLS